MTSEASYLDSEHPTYPQASPPTHSQSSMDGNASKEQATEVQDMRCEIVASYLHQQQQERLWLSGEQEDQGVVVRKSRDCYISCPSNVQNLDDGIAKAAKTLNTQVAITVTTKVVRLLLHNPTSRYIALPDGRNIQVLPSISHLRQWQHNQCFVLVSDRQQLIVWGENPALVLKRAADIELQLVQSICQGYFSDLPCQEEAADSSTITEASASSVDKTAGDSEAAHSETTRPIILYQAGLSAFALLLTFAALGLGWRAIAVEISIDRGWIRLGFVLLFPIHAWLGMFFFQALVGNIFQVVGPIRQISTNSKFYSALAPDTLERGTSEALPHITVQMPVYKESLSAVIAPTVMSIKAAISTYEMQGGSAGIFVNDDGMQLLDKDAAQARQDFYRDHNVGWVARPRHNPSPTSGEQTFLRRGKFKKASNLNYALWISTRIEEKLLGITRSDQWTEADEMACYQEALAGVVEGDGGKTWAEGDVRVGDYILLVDSDTRVPADYFLEVVSELEMSPEVAVLQFPSGVMNVTDNFFEKGITFFTNLVYTQIRFAVANGDVAPFVGHNAFIRWSAMQQIGYHCYADSREKYWSESTVSEDFDMALRLQAAGYLVRLAAYAGAKYQEGVSLTVYDELARWEKYAYGCSEFVFHPLRYWVVRGPFTPLFRTFITSCMPLYSKITILAYVGTYFAIGSAWLLTLLNYFLVGWFNGFLDHFYLDSFKAYFAIIVVFTFLGNFSLAILRYRTEDQPLISAFLENIKWIPLLVIFLGGISIHVSQAILSHLLSIDRVWTTTSKEAEDTTFFREIPKVLARFKVTFVFCTGCTTIMVVLAWFAPPLWQIRLFVAIWPLAVVVCSHFLLPIVLNPGLMLFTW